MTVRVRRVLLILLLAPQQLASPVSAATPTPTSFLPPTSTPTPIGGGGGAAAGDLITAEEPAVTLFLHNGLERAVVFTNGANLATYDFVNNQPVLVSKGTAPVPQLYGIISDPGAVTQPNGTIFISALGVAPSLGMGSLFVWHSSDGVQFGNPVHVVDYPFSHPPDWSYPDKPWLAVSRLSGRLWLVWRAISGSEGPCCVSTSQDGINWSPCVNPEPACNAAMSVAANGGDSAVVIWDREGRIEYSRCTASVLTVSCSPTALVTSNFRGYPGNDVLPGLRAGSLPTIAGNDTTGSVVVVWGQQLQPQGAPLQGQIVWSENLGTNWSPPVPVTTVLPSQLMPAIAYSEAAHSWMLTLYQWRQNTTLFDVDAYLYRNDKAVWQFIRSLGAPVTQSVSHFFGDYSWIDCPSTCAVAYTGSNTTTTPFAPEIDVTLVDPIDRDSDGIEDPQDNCPDAPNPPIPPAAMQQDSDCDGAGDACDPGCIGDCMAPIGSVDIGDLQVALNIFFGSTSLANCTKADGNGDGVVDIGDLTRALNNFFDGCGSHCGQGGGASVLSTVSVSVETTTAFVGETVDIPITLDNTASDVAGLQLDLTFDSAVFGSPECTLHPRLTGRHFEYAIPTVPPLPPGQDAIRLVVYDEGAAPSITDGPIATCHFDVVSGAAPGVHHLVPNRVAVSDGQGNYHAFDLVGGAITIDSNALALVRSVPAVGSGLQDGTFKVAVEAPPGTSKTVTIESNTPSACLVGTIGSSSGVASISRSIGASSTESNAFYVKGLEGIESVCRLELRASGYATSYAFIDIVKPAVRITGLPTSVEYRSANVPFSIEIGVADANNSDLAVLQAVRGGHSFTINIHSSNPQAGELVSPASGSFQQDVVIDISATHSQSDSGLQFDPISAGLSTTVAATNASVSATQNAGVTVSVYYDGSSGGGGGGGGGSC